MQKWWYFKICKICRIYTSDRSTMNEHENRGLNLRIFSEISFLDIFFFLLFSPLRSMHSIQGVRRCPNGLCLGCADCGTRWPWFFKIEKNGFTTFKGYMRSRHYANIGMTINETRQRGSNTTDSQAKTEKKLFVCCGGHTETSGWNFEQKTMGLSGN